MPRITNVERQALSNAARAVLLLALAINILTILVVAYYYPTLPNTVATHYGAGGAANSYGNKSALLIVPSIFLVIFALFLVVLRFRYTLLEKYPYLLNLPSFIYRLGMEKNPKLHGDIMNKVFTVYSFSLFYIAVLDLTVTTAIMTQSASMLLPAILIIISVFLVTILLLYRRIYRSFAVPA